jgi:hypothetical protein
MPLPSVTPDGPASIVLTGDRRRLFDDILVRYTLDAANEALLRSACESLERAAQLAEAVNRDGPTFKDRFNSVRVNPAAQLERDFRGLAARTLQQLATRFEG